VPQQKAALGTPTVRSHLETPDTKPRLDAARNG
jgi:hypothetical protein